MTSFHVICNIVCFSESYESRPASLKIIKKSINSDPYAIANTLEKEKFKALGLSCSLSINVRFVKETIEKVRAITQFSGPIIVGGRIFNLEPALKKYVDADYHGKDFYEAVDILNKIHNIGVKNGQPTLPFI